MIKIDTLHNCLQDMIFYNSVIITETHKIDNYSLKKLRKNINTCVVLLEKQLQL